PSPPQPPPPRGGEGGAGSALPPPLPSRGGGPGGGGARNSTARKSSSSGYVGGSPCTPKSSGVRTRPAPKSSCQKRLTATRAVSGFCGDTIQRASLRRSFFPSFGRGGNTAGTSGATFSPRRS